MEILRFTIAAGETKRFEKAGRYIEVIEAESALSLFFFDENGGQADDAQGIVSGLYIEGSYKAFTVYSASAQSINLIIADGRGGSRRQPGNVTVIDKVGSSCQTVTVSDLTIGFTAAALVAPASNINGVILRASNCSVNPGAGAALSRLLGAMVMPTSVSPGANSVLLNTVFGAASGVEVNQPIFDQRRFIPPGWGLWFVKSNSMAANGCSVLVSFEVL